MFGEHGITHVIKAQRIRWLGHAQRIPNGRQSLISQRRRGRPMKKWLETVEEDLGVENWLRLAKDRNEWKSTTKQAFVVCNIKVNVVQLPKAAATPIKIFGANLPHKCFVMLD